MKLGGDGRIEVEIMDNIGCGVLSCCQTVVIDCVRGLWVRDLLGKFWLNLHCFPRFSIYLYVAPAEPEVPTPGHPSESARSLGQATF